MKQMRDFGARTFPTAAYGARKRPLSRNCFEWLLLTQRRHCFVPYVFPRIDPILLLPDKA